MSSTNKFRISTDATGFTVHAADALVGQALCDLALLSNSRQIELHLTQDGPYGKQRVRVIVDGHGYLRIERATEDSRQFLVRDGASGAYMWDTNRPIPQLGRTMARLPTGVITE